jgi:hypothetical protein
MVTYNIRYYRNWHAVTQSLEYILILLINVWSILDCVFHSAENSRNLQLAHTVWQAQLPDEIATISLNSINRPMFVMQKLCVYCEVGTELLITLIRSFVVLPSSTYSQQVSMVFVFHLITLRHIPQSVGLLWTRDRPVAEPSTWQHTNTHKRHTSMPPVGFEPTIPASARPQTYALDRAATITLININLY